MPDTLSSSAARRRFLHLVPSGVLHRGKTCVIGNGVVVDPLVLLEEVEQLRKRGLLERDEDLRISEQAHLILPYHKAIDLAREAAARSRQDRHDGPRHRTGLRRQDGANRHPRRRSPRGSDLS